MPKLKRWCKKCGYRLADAFTMAGDRDGWTHLRCHTITTTRDCIVSGNPQTKGGKKDGATT